MGDAPLPSEICVQSDPPPSKNADFDRAIDGVRTLPLSALKGGSKTDYFAFEHKSTADRLKRCQLSWPVSVINM